MGQENRVVSPHHAIIDGKKTGLAGCASEGCNRAAYCIRADAQLAMRANHRLTGKCNSFIPVGAAA